MSLVKGAQISSDTTRSRMKRKVSLGVITNNQIIQPRKTIKIFDDSKNKQYNEIQRQRMGLIKERINRIQSEVKRIINEKEKENQETETLSALLWKKKQSGRMGEIIKKMTDNHFKNKIDFNEKQFINKHLDQFIEDQISQDQYMDIVNFPIISFMKKQNIPYSDKVLIQKTKRSILDH